MGALPELHLFRDLACAARLIKRLAWGFSRCATARTLANASTAWLFDGTRFVCLFVSHRLSPGEGKRVSSYERNCWQSRDADSSSSSGGGGDGGGGTLRGHGGAAALVGAQAPNVSAIKKAKITVTASLVFLRVRGSLPAFLRCCSLSNRTHAS
jgi:hypothetical protein